MLDQMRRNSRSGLILILFGILIAVFILTFNNPSNQGGAGMEIETLAEVSGTTIDTAEFELARRMSADPPNPGLQGFDKLQAQQRYEARLVFSGVPAGLAMLSPFEGKAPANQYEKILTELTESVLVAEDAKKHGLGVSDTELSRRVLALQRVYGIELTDATGKFDPRKYDQLVRFQLGTSKAGLETFLRREILRDKMAQIVTGAITVAPAEVDAMYAAEKARPTLEYVTIDADVAAKALQIPDAEAEAWATAHPDKITAAYEAKADVYKVADKFNVRGILVAAPSPDEATDEAKKKEAADQRQAKKATADGIRADLDKAWNGQTALEPVPAPKPEGAAEAPPAEGTPTTADQLPPDEKTKRLLHFFSKVATEKTEHMLTKESGGVFVEDKSVESLKRSPFGPAVGDAVAQAQELQVVGPVEGAQGWWILVVEKKIPGKTTPIEEVRLTLAKEALAREKAEAELDKLAQTVLEAAQATPTTALEEVVKKWNATHGGGDDGPLHASTTPPIGKSPLAALTGGIEAMLGLPEKAEDPADIPGLGKVPALADAAWKLSADKPVAPQVYKSEDGKIRYVVRLAKPKDDDKDAAAKEKEQLAQTLQTIRKQEAWRAYVRKLLQEAEKAGKIERTDAFARLRDEEQKRLAEAEKKVPAAAPGGLPPGLQLNVGGQNVPVQPAKPEEAPAK